MKVVYTKHTYKCAQIIRVPLIELSHHKYTHSQYPAQIGYTSTLETSLGTFQSLKHPSPLQPGVSTVLNSNCRVEYLLLNFI